MQTRCKPNAPQADTLDLMLECRAAGGQWLRQTAAEAEEAAAAARSVRR